MRQVEQRRGERSEERQGHNCYVRAAEPPCHPLFRAPSASAACQLQWQRREQPINSPTHAPAADTAASKCLRSAASSVPQARFFTKMLLLSASSACASASPVSSSASGAAAALVLLSLPDLPAAAAGAGAAAAAAPLPALALLAAAAAVGAAAERGGGGLEKIPLGAHSRYSGTCWYRL